MLVPLALAEFIGSFAGSNMNVMINDMSEDLEQRPGRADRDHHLPAGDGRADDPGGKLTDRRGRKRCFTPGLAVYVVGACSLRSPGVSAAYRRQSTLEGIGTDS